MRRILVTMAAVLLLASAVIRLDAATAAELTVTDCGDTTPGGASGQLRRLITDAAPGDTIVVPACLIQLTGAADEDANASGDLDIAKDLVIRGAGARRTVIDGGALDRVFDVLASATVTVSDLMVRNGRVLGSGGGVQNAGTLTLERVIVRKNVTEADAVQEIFALAAGISNGGTLTVVESAVVSNTSDGGIAQLSSAGGIYNFGTATIVRSTVSGNIAALGSAGINSTGPLHLLDSTVSGNTTFIGAGAITAVDVLSVVGSAVAHNSSGPGGPSGIRALPLSAPPFTPFTLVNTIVTDNLTFMTPANVQCEHTSSLGGNLDSDGTCALGGPGDATSLNAGLGPLADEGGLTQTHAVLPGSPAIGTALAGPCDGTDQRGMPRPTICDKGPFQFTPPIFTDVPATRVARGAMEALFVNGVTGGCLATPRSFCPDAPLTREQLAVFLLRALEGAGFVPPPATGLFTDVPIADPFAPWIEELFNRGITAGCDATPRRFCPDVAVTRAQLALLLLKTLSAPAFVPPPATGLFIDMAPGDPFMPWAEEFFRRGLTEGCGFSFTFCPNDPATRAQAAIFLVRAFGFGF